MGMLEGITKHKWYEDRIHRQTAVLEAINKVFLDSLRCDNDKDVAGACLLVAEHLTGSEFGFIAEVNPSGRLDTIALSDPGRDSWMIPQSELVSMGNNMEIRGIYACVIEEGRSVIVNDPAGNPDLGIPEGHPLVFCFLGVPLKRSGKTIGLIGLANKESGYMITDQQEIETLSFAFLEALMHKRAEEALELALKDWQNTFEAISDGIWILDLEGRVIKSNRVLKDMLGITTEEVIGQYCYKTLHHTSTFIENCPFERMTQTGMRESFELQDKERGLWLHVTVDPISDATGKITKAVHIVRNVTELKKAEELRLENERLMHASQAKSDFLATMSHELRTPLNAILGFSEILNLKIAGELNTDQESYVDDIHAAGKHLLNLINDILDLSKVEAGKIELAMEKISVSEMIKDVLVLIKEKAMKHNVIIEKELDPHLEYIEADQQRLKQILFNLLSNAVKFSKEEGGTVTISAKKEENMANISISDTGIGIREEDMDKLFKEFHQINSGFTRKYGGTGLGLAITRKLVELHGGKIVVESKYGEGSTFTVVLPSKAK